MCIQCSLGLQCLDNLTEVGPDDHDRDDDRTLRTGSRSSRPSRRTRGGGSQTSGRKQAAKLFPLNYDSPCEWKGKANCGGGDYPILGCPSVGEQKQQARHHGPEKNVQNNEVGNVHRICHYCHYRWHAKNDPTYDWNAGVWPAHNPRPLTPEEEQKQILDMLRYEATTKRSNKRAREVD